MPLFSDAKMQKFAKLRKKFEYRSDCIIKRPTTVETDYGKKDELITIGECKGSRKRAGSTNGALIQIYAERYGSLNVWQVSMPLGQDVLEGDIINMEGDDMKVQDLQKETWIVSTDVLASVVS